MGKLKTKLCLITSLNVDKNYEDDYNGWSYNIILGFESVKIKINEDFNNWKNDKLFIDNKHIIAGAIINKILFEKSSQYEITYDFLKERLKQLTFPRNSKEKIENLLVSLVRNQKYDGELVSIFNLAKSSFFYYKHYFKNVEECNFYLKTLQKNGYIDAQFNNSTGIIIEYALTHKGLEYYFEIYDNKVNSKNCFIAMSFGEDMIEIRNAIIITGYIPIFIDEQNFESHRTINDAIIAELKKSKFCIADFTEQKDGVYFESGFALGLGRPVIYCCRNDWFDKSHFDIKHFSHIIYENSDELEVRLINKINAWIN